MAKRKWIFAVNNQSNESLLLVFGCVFKAKFVIFTSYSIIYSQINTNLFKV